jgi:peptidoglycan/xylan/chitin deacetylase (PgdA/CDA1 family)
VGAPVALARRQPRLAMERGTRVAESAGSLIAAALAQGDLHPEARETPFRASVPPPRRHRAVRRGRRASSSPVILLYHRIAEHPSDAVGVGVSPANFARQVEVLKSTREVVPLADIAARDASSSAAAVTFDDGYRDNLEEAAPALASAGVPATLFVSTGHVAEGRGFWWDELEHILRTPSDEVAPALTLELRGQRRAFRVGSEHERRMARGHLHAWLQPMAPEDIASALEVLRAWAGYAGECRTPEPARAMTPEELRAFVGFPGLTAGAHGRSHRSLRHADRASQEAEIAGSRDDLAAWLGHEPTSFSYPFGVPGADLDEAVVARVRAAGFSLGVTTAPGALAGADRLVLPRRVVPDLDAKPFEEWLRAPAYS